MIIYRSSKLKLWIYSPFFIFSYFSLFINFQLIFLYLINNHFMLYYLMHLFDHLFIYLTKILRLLFSFYNFAVILAKWLKVKTRFWRFLLLVNSCHTLYFKVFYLKVLVLNLYLLLVDLFAHVYRISVQWSQ